MATIYKVPEAEPGQVLNLPFSKLSEAEVIVYADGVAQVSSLYSWTGASQITLGDSWPSNQMTIVARYTAVEDDEFGDQPLSGYFNARTANENTQRTAYALQELRDIVADLPDAETLEEAIEAANASDWVNAPEASQGMPYVLGKAPSDNELVKGRALLWANDWGLSSGKTASQNRVAMEAALAALEGAGGGRMGIFPGAFTHFDLEPLDIPDTIRIEGVNPESVELRFEESVGTNWLEFVKTTGLYKWAGIKGVSLNNVSGARGGLGIFTPVDGAAFSDVRHWVFEELQWKGSKGFQKYMRLGDANQGSIRNCEWRGNYNATITDVGQDNCSAMEFTGSSGNIGYVVDGCMVVGVRTPLVFTNFSEGFAVVNSELVNCWDGITLNPDPSKPGGFIDNVHMNVQHRGITATRKRDLEIGNVQVYRSNGWHDHTGDWKAIELDTCGGVSVKKLTARVAPGYVNDAGVTAMEVLSSTQVDIGTIICREQATVDTALHITNSQGGSIQSMITNQTPIWVDIDGTSEGWSFGSFTKIGTAPSSTPFIVDLTSASKGTTQFDRKRSGFRQYTDHGTKTAGGTETMYPGFSGEAHKWSFSAGAGTYTYNIELDTVNAVVGDRLDIKFTFLNTTNPTCIIKQGIGGSTILSLNNGTGGNWFPRVVLEFNGTGWVTHSYVANIS